MPTPREGSTSRPIDTLQKRTPRTISKEDQNAIDGLAARFFEGSGDMMAVSHSIRNVILARFEWVKKHGKDAGE